MAAPGATSFAVGMTPKNNTFGFYDAHWGDIVTTNNPPTLYQWRIMRRTGAAPTYTYTQVHPAAGAPLPTFTQ